MCQVHLVVAGGSAVLGRILRPGPKGINIHLNYNGFSFCFCLNLLNIFLFKKYVPIWKILTTCKMINTFPPVLLLFLYVYLESQEYVKCISTFIYCIINTFCQTLVVNIFFVGGMLNHKDFT